MKPVLKTLSHTNQYLYGCQSILSVSESYFATLSPPIIVDQDWVNSRRVKVSDLQAKFAQAKDEFLQTVVFFGEDKKTPPDVLFAIFRDFLTDFAVSCSPSHRLTARPPSHPTYL